jgi:hypothetical protein
MNKKQLIRFSNWLQTHFKFRARDMSETKIPWYWKNFSFANAVALKGKYVYIREKLFIFRDSSASDGLSTW